MADRIHTQTTRTTYEVNGRVYDAIKDVPEPYRSLFEDRDGDGLPDMIREVDAMRRSVIRSTSSTNEMRSWLDPRHPHHGVGAPREMNTLVCGSCGYDLSGSSVGGVCPECGSSVMQSIREITYPKQSRFWRVVDLLVFDRSMRSAVSWLIILVAASVFVLLLKFVL